MILNLSRFLDSYKFFFSWTLQINKGYAPLKLSEDIILFFYDIRVLDVVSFLFPVCASEHFEFKHDEKMTTKMKIQKIFLRNPMFIMYANI